MVVVQTGRVDIDVDQSLVHIRQPTIAFPIVQAGAGNSDQFEDLWSSGLHNLRFSLIKYFGRIRLIVRYHGRSAALANLSTRRNFL